MNHLLTRLLQKRKVTIDDLDQDEKKTFEEWQKTLSKDELTLEDVKSFCESQVDIIENKWTDYNIDQAKKNELLPYHTVYKTISNVIKSPKVAREALEKNLEQLLNQ